MIRMDIRNLGKWYGSNRVLHDFTWDVRAAVVGISGSNGSGKSTLLKCIAGLSKPGSGSINWSRNGQIVSPAEIKKGTGFAAPYVELYEGMSVHENLQFLWDLNRDRENSSRERIPGLLDRFRASAFANRLYGELSTGQRQRVKLAASCIHNPFLLCLDEPGSNLDADGRQLVRETLQDFEKSGRMVIIASNQPDELELCQEIADLDKIMLK